MTLKVNMRSKGKFVKIRSLGKAPRHFRWDRWAPDLQCTWQDRASIHM